MEKHLTHYTLPASDLECSELYREYVSGLANALKARVEGYIDDSVLTELLQEFQNAIYLLRQQFNV